MVTFLANSCVSMSIAQVAFLDNHAVKPRNAGKVEERKIWNQNEIDLSQIVLLIIFAGLCSELLSFKNTKLSHNTSQRLEKLLWREQTPRRPEKL